MCNEYIMRQYWAVSALQCLNEPPINELMHIFSYIYSYNRFRSGQKLIKIPFEVNVYKLRSIMFV